MELPKQFDNITLRVIDDQRLNLLKPFVEVYWELSSKDNKISKLTGI